VPNNEGARQALEEEINVLLDKQVVERIEHPSLAFWSRIFLVPKPDGRWRVILNLKPLNAYLKTSSFKMETVQRIAPLLRRGWWATSIDLTDAYYHVPIHPDFRHLFQFHYRETAYKYRAMPFGLATAPEIFTTIALEAASVVKRSLDVDVFVYLDDWLLVHRSKDHLRRSTQETISILREFGFLVNLQKSSLSPTRKIVHLGTILDFEEGFIRPTPERLANLQRCILRVNTHKPVKAKRWQILLGHMASLTVSVPLARLHMRQLQIHLRRHWSQKRDSEFKKIPPTGEDLQQWWNWWKNQSNLAQGRPFQDPVPDLIVTTDASGLGWGGYCGNQSFSGEWLPYQRRFHINWKELKAVQLTLKRLGLDTLSNKCILVRTDNTTTMAYINREGGTRSSVLCALAIKLLLWAKDNNITIKARYLQGILNVRADALSRNLLPQTEWSLNPGTRDRILTWEPGLTIDLFASSLNHQLPLFFSLEKKRGGEIVPTDALTEDWNHLTALIFPPFNLLPRVVAKLEVSRVSGIVIAPLWPRQPWFLRLCRLLVEPPRRLHQDRDRLWHPLDPRAGTAPTTWKLAAWRISTQSSVLLTSHRDQQISFDQQRGIVPREPTTHVLSTFSLGAEMLALNQLPFL
jgi:hypothetical protein